MTGRILSTRKANASKPLSGLSLDSRSVHQRVVKPTQKRITNLGNDQQNAMDLHEKERNGNLGGLPQLMWNRTKVQAEESQMIVEVSTVVNDMLVDLEYWWGENQWREQQAALAKQQAEINSLKESLETLTLQRAEDERRNTMRATEAKEVRDDLMNELWALSKTMKASAACEQKLKRADKDLMRLGRLERELDAARRDIRQFELGVVATSTSSGGSDVTEGLVTWIHKCLGGGDKWREAANQYTANLIQARVISVVAVTRLSERELVDMGFTQAHACVICAGCLPSAPIGHYPAPFMVCADNVLLKIFKYMTAWSVFSTAQVCRAFFSRVDMLFGMGSTIVVARPAQPRAKPIRSKDNEKGTGLTAALATQIAAKLNSTEMKGIIGMTQRIKELETISSQLNEAKEDTEERLQTEASVKEFLVTKLRDTEMALKRSIDSANETKRQNQADQEVINFLDSRVQDLESQLLASQTQGDESKGALRVAEEVSKKQLKSLEDMLHWEKERSAKNETEAKSQKRLLVKEVKTLRAQLSITTTERDAYKQQVRRLQMQRG